MLKGLLERWSDPITLFTGCLVLVTIFQAWLFMKSERAFVFPTAANFQGPLIPGQEAVTIYVVFKNSGRSAAEKEEFSAQITHILPDPPEYRTAPKFAIPPVVAGGEIQQPLDFKTGWTEENIGQIRAGQLPFYIYGSFKYRDDYSFFLGSRESRFCFRYVPALDSANAIFRTCNEPQFTHAH